MVVKEPCPNCTQSKTCRSVYRQITGRHGPSVASRSFAAFLLPLLVFIAALAISRNAIPYFPDNYTIQTLVCFLFAAVAASVTIPLTRLFYRLHDNSKTLCT